jgi:signal transduction histidine kinase/CheY-like chemotaxis protein
MNELYQKSCAFISKIWENMSKSTKESEILFVPFGYLLIIGYLGFYYFNLLIAEPTGYENFSMRIVVVVLGVGLVLKNFWTELIRKYMPIYWYITLIYSLPFFFFFMLFKNPESNIWQINGLVGMVSLTFFVDWIGYIILSLIGISLAYLVFCIPYGITSIHPSLVGVFGSYSASIVFLVLFSYRRKQYKDKLLSEEKTFNAKLLKQSVKLKKALSIKTEFFNNISHEVRTPISGVLNISELLVDNWKKYTPKEHFENVKLIARSGKRLLMIMNSILDLSKFESGKMSINISKWNLEQLIKDTIKEHIELYLNNRRDIIIETCIQPKLDSNIDMDSEKIIQVLRNLIGNAIKFTVSGKIKICLQKQGNNLEVIVKDEGVGIPENELEYIFSSFVQSSRTKNKAGGTGLGLAICKEIVEAHDGRIWALNNLQKGASLHFLLPKASALLEKQAEKKEDHTGKILVIDDDQTCHSILTLLLKVENYEMVSAYSGTEGLEYLRKKNRKDIRLIFLDLMMPDMYGLNVLKEIKADKLLSDIPVVIQTASHDPSEHSKAIELGAVSFLKKPYNREEINAVLRDYIKKSSF